MLEKVKEKKIKINDEILKSLQSNTPESEYYDEIKQSIISIPSAFNSLTSQTNYPSFGNRWFSFDAV